MYSYLKKNDIKSYKLLKLLFFFFLFRVFLSWSTFLSLWCGLKPHRNHWEFPFFASTNKANLHYNRFFFPEYIATKENSVTAAAVVRQNDAIG